MKLDIRKAQEKDKEAFIELCLGLTNFNIKFNIKNCLNNDKLNERLRKRREKSNKIFEEYRAKQDPLILLASLNNKPVGYAIAYIIDNEYGYLDEIYIEEETRRLGIGKKLLDFVTEWVKEKKVENLRLNVFLWNENAIDFYKKEGFEGYFMGCIKKLS